MVFVGICQAQELPPVKNFTPSDYGSGNQNWSISQSHDKIIFVANNEGLLEFNGTRWTLYPSPNQTIMRSVKAIGNRIYTGCYMEFGYWERSKLGVLRYTSLTDALNTNLLEDEEFWNILEVDGWVVFQSLNQIYIYNPQTHSINRVNSDEMIVKIFEVNEQIYFQRKGKGIFRIVNGRDSLLTDENTLKNDEVTGIFPDGKSLLILTRHNGLYTYQNNQVTKKMSYIDSHSNLSIYNVTKLNSGDYALGTISHGVIILDTDLNLKWIFNQGNSLLNNTALFVFEDAKSNLWVGLDNGISYLNINSKIRAYRDQNGHLGSVYASAIFDGNLYLGTNQGLFYRPITDKSDFKFVEGTQGQVWNLKKIGDDLFCGHHTGTYVVESNGIKKISPVSGTWNLKLLNDSLILQGNYDGLYVMTKVSGQWKLRNKIEGFDNSSRYFEVLGKSIFVNHEYKGIFKLEVDDSFSNVLETKIDTTLICYNSSIAKFKGKIHYACKNGIFEYDEKTEEFVKNDLLSTIYSEEEYMSGRFVVDIEEESFWIFTKNNLIFVSSDNLTDQPKIDRIPLAFEMRKNVIEYESILAIDGYNQYLLGTSFGYLIFDKENLTSDEFSIQLNSVSLGINADYSASNSLVDNSIDGHFNSDENNIRISYHTSEYIKYFNPSYQFQLIGIYDIWSEWTNQSTVFYENLPPGNYTFNVRSRIGNTLSSNVASYEFYIAKPWYRTNLMIAIYFLGVIAFSIFMHHVYKRYYRKQQEKLIETNKKELELTRLQNEKEIVNIKNEQLEKDFKNKSNELAASTMSVIKKNELLTQIKEQLSTIADKDAIKPVIKIIDRSLSHNQNWEMFKEAFDNVDTEFFKILKSKHPNLSPNDLKLCAYLRLNLSSKEVSQLINISPRSVEVKRYRLRKKMNLNSDQNLTNYILSI